MKENYFKKYTWLLLLLAFGLVILHWMTDDIKPDNLVYKVNSLGSIPFFETPYLYLYLHLSAFIPVFLLSFDRKVAYHKTWKYLFPTLLIVAVIFWIWDVAKTHFQVWGFNPKYTTFFVGNLPVEEWFFFLTFPFCSVFIYECLEAYFPRDGFRKWDTPLSIFFGLGFFSVGIANWGHSYTATTWIPAGLFALWHFFTFDNTYRTRFYRAFLIGLIPFFIINSILTGIATLEPIVIYNPEEYLGMRIGTVPLDDFAYNFLMQFMIMSFYAYFKKIALKINAPSVFQT